MDPDFRPIDFSFETRRHFLQEFSRTSYDICVIGGGITGAGVARDAALRGLKTVILEKADFASGTSSRSSKLVHGGMRYLRYLKFGLVHEALIERHLLMRLAPHLIARLPCILPIYEGMTDGYWKIKAGVSLYDILCGRRHIGRHRMLAAAELKGLVPDIRPENLRGGALYYDAKTDDTRLVMATVQSAVAAGCRAVNYLSAHAFDIEGGKATALYATDSLNGERHKIEARVFVNAGGPWSDSVRNLVDRDMAPRLRPTKGAHIIVPFSRLPLEYAIMLMSPIDNRPVYAIPCRENDVVMLGTTDTDFTGDFDSPWTDAEDVTYLFTSFGHYFPGLHLEHEDIVSTFAGLRPLIYEAGKTTAEVSREHAIFASPGNVVHIIGGKLTTYRAMAIDILHYLSRKCGIRTRSRSLTDRYPLYGGEMQYPQYLAQKTKEITGEFQLPEKVARHLIFTYGRGVEELLPLLREDASLGEPIVTGLPFIWAELPYSVRREMAMCLDDFLIRRTHIFSLDSDQGQSVLPRVGDAMAGILGWSEEEKRRQVQRYLREVDLCRKYRGPETTV